MKDKGTFWWNINGLFYQLLMNDVHHQLFRDVLDALGDLDGVRIDDFGCGTGELLSLFPETSIVRGIDVSSAALQKARKKNPRAKLLEIDFYRTLPGEYTPDVIVACRSLYHSDLEVSISLLSDHLGEEGIAVIAHPVLDWWNYVRPNRDGSRRIDIIQVIKSSGRLFSRLFGYPYALFSKEDFQRIGGAYFDKVSVSYGGKGTHYLVKLSK